MWDENESSTLFDDFDDQWGTFHIQECFISIPPLFLLMTGAICCTYMSDILVSPLSFDVLRVSPFMKWSDELCMWAFQFKKWSDEIHRLPDRVCLHQTTAMYVRSIQTAKYGAFEGGTMFKNTLWSHHC